MPLVSFHFNVPDPVQYACRLLRKATRQGSNVVVSAAAAELAALDKALWTFDPIEFIPHTRLAPGQVLPERLARTPVCLAEHATDAPGREVLVNLGHAAPEGHEAFERVVEIVSPREDDRAAARQRWRGYAAAGFVIERHEVGG